MNERKKDRNETTRTAINVSTSCHLGLMTGRTLHERDARNPVIAYSDKKNKDRDMNWQPTT